MASSNVLSELGFTGVDASGTVNQIESSMKLLQDSSNLLSNGSKTLKNGTADMKAGLKTYTNGVSQLNNGLKTLNDGMPKLAAGSKQLADGSNQLYNKLSASVFNNDSLKGLINSYSYVNAKLSAAPYKDLYTTIKGMNDTKTAFAKLPEDKQMPFLNSATKAATSGALSDYNQLSADKKADVQNLCVLGLMISAKNGSDGSELIADFTKFGTYRNEYDQAAAALANRFNALGTNELADIDVASGKVKPNGEAWLSATGSFQQEWNKLGEAAASGHTAAATTAATTYYAKYLAFQKKNASIGSISSSLPELQSGVAQLRDGSALLHKSIVDTLVPGVSALYNGSALLSGNSSKLNVGAAKLDEGALQLSNGMVKFNEEGIQKISGAFSGDIKELTDRIKAIDTASKEYTTFSGTTEDMSSTVKFVIETKGVRAKTK
jgi:putative membrane protein